MHTSPQPYPVAERALTVSHDSLATAFEDNPDIFQKALKLGRVRGIAAFAGDPRRGPAQVATYVKVARELIKRDILTLFTDWENPSATGIAGDEAFLHAGEGLAEFCGYLGIAPVTFVSSPPEADAAWDSLDLLARLAAVGVADLPMALVTDLPAGDPIEAADAVDGQIHDRRLALEWHDRYHCSEETYS